MILLYHNIIPDPNPPWPWYIKQARPLPLSFFKRHINWLSAHFQIVSLSEYLTNIRVPTSRREKTVSITFDDCTSITFRCAFSVLAEQRVPATFFVTTCHLEHGELLWFSYLNALCFGDLYDSITIDNRVFDLHTPRQRVQARRALGALARASGSPINFSRELARVYPFSQSTKAFYEGMTYNQLHTAGESDFIEIGGHTLTHPFLSQQTKSAQAIELIKSKQILAELTSNTVRYFAYPSGDYNHDTLELVKTAGYEAGFAVNPKNLGTDPRFEIDRTGIYSTSLLKLHMKALGVTRFARRFGFQVG